MGGRAHAFSVAFACVDVAAAFFECIAKLGFGGSLVEKTVLLDDFSEEFGVALELRDVVIVDAKLFVSSTFLAPSGVSSSFFSSFIFSFSCSTIASVRSA